MNYLMYQRGRRPTTCIYRDASTTYDYNPLSSRKYLSQYSKMFSLASEMTIAQDKLVYIKVTQAFCVPYVPVTYEYQLIAWFVLSRLMLSKLYSMQMSSYNTPSTKQMYRQVIKESKILK